MKRSYLFKAVGVLIILVLFFALPTTAFAAETQATDDLGQLLDRIPGFSSGQPYVPDIPADLKPGTFYINMFAYEQRVTTDEKFALIVSYAYSGQSVSPAYQPKLKIVLSKEIQYTAFYNEDLEPISGEVSILDSGEQEVTFTLPGPIAAGSIGNIIVAAKLNEDQLNSTSTPTARAEISAASTETAVTDDVVISPIINPSDWMLMLVQDYPSVVPAPGGEVTYGVTLYGNSEENGLDLSNVTIKVAYPEKAEVLDSDGGTVDTENHTVSWDYGSLIAGETAEYILTLRYSTDYYTYAAANTAGKANSVSLSAKASANVSGMEGLFSIAQDLTHGFAAPQLVLGDAKIGSSLDADMYCAGELATYTIYGMENKGNVNYKKAVITVDVPDSLFLQYIDTGNFNMDVNVQIQYLLNSTDGWVDWATVSSLKSTRLKVGDLPFLTPIDKVRWIFTEGNETIKPGFTGKDSVKFGANVIGKYGTDTTVTALVQAASADNVSVSLSNSDVLKVRTILPDDLPAWRQEIVDTAFILQGKVEYYLGGKSYVIGWDDRWGKVQYNSNSGKTEAYGLDCSGFAVWVLINAGFNATEVKNDFGIATYYEWPNCYPVTVDEVLPGDMVFRQPPTAAGMNHVGIVVGHDKNGTLLVAHCAGSYNTVVVTPYDGTFFYMRRPYIYDDK